MINFSELFYYCPTSPSGLRRKTDWVSGDKYHIIKKYAGDVAGSFGGGRTPYWCVKIGHKSYRVHRIIWVLVNGELSKDEYIDHIDGNPRNNLLSNLRVVSNKVNSRNQKFRSTNTSGVNGVGLLVNKTKSGENRYWKAQWNDLSGKRCAKCFSIVKYGNEEAFRLACEYRENILKELNNQGAGYVERHGK